MSFNFLSSVSSLLILFVSATVASAQNVLLFTFDDTGTNITATVTGSFDTAGLTFSGQATPHAPDTFRDATGTVLAFGTTTASNIDLFDGAFAMGGPLDFFPFLTNFPVCEQGDSIITPLSEYFEINVQTLLNMDQPINTSIRLAEGKTVFNADALANNVIVFKQGSLIEFGNGSGTLSTTPFTVLADRNRENIIQFVLRDADLGPPIVILGDVNRDGAVNFLDISPFIDSLATTSPYIPEADINQSGEVNFLDIGPFVAALAGE